MNNTIQHHDSYLDTARDARAGVIKQTLKSALALLRAMVRVENAEAVMAAASVAVGLLAVISL